MHRSGLLALIAAVLVSIGLALALTVPWEIAQEKVRSASLTTSRDLPGEIMAEGWVSTNEARFGETIRVWISLQNVSKRNVSGVRLVDLEVPGFSRQPPCWTRDLPVCIDSTTPRATIPSELAPGQSITFSGDLKPTQVGRYALFAVFAWSDSAGGTARKGLPLGPVQVTTWWHETGRRLLALTQVIVLPLLAAGLALFFQRKDRRQELAQASLAQRTEVLRTLLPQFLHDAQKYYLPIASDLSDLLRPTKDLEEQFLNLMSLMSNMSKLNDEIGGFQFQNLTGEHVMALAWEAFIGNLRDSIGRAELADAVVALPADMSGPALEAIIKEQPGGALGKLRNAFASMDKDWFKQQAPLLEIFYLALGYEMNRPFELWYGALPPFPLNSLKEKEVCLPTTPKGIIQELKEELNKYIEPSAAPSKRPAKAGFRANSPKQRVAPAKSPQDGERAATEPAT